MAYFTDLTPYSYAETDVDRFNVGWLDDEHAFPKAPADPLPRKALAYVLKFQVNETTGTHACVLCGRLQISFADDDGNERLLGAAELHIDGNDGSAFAAPSLVVHHVVEHDYAPPASFCRAVIDNAEYYGMQ